jgi:hypothetical protein
MLRIGEKTNREKTTLNTESIQNELIQYGGLLASRPPTQLAS